MIMLPAVTTAWADIGMGRPSPSMVNMPRQGVYHSDLLASNAVRAVFKGLRTIPVVDLAMPTDATEEVAVFEVKQNLAHRRYDRMGDGALNEGRLFSVSLAADVPGQAADVGRQIREMKPGDEALLNIDHIYLFRDEGNENVRAVTRFAKVTPQPQGVQGVPGAPATPAQSAVQGVPAVPVTPAQPAGPVPPAPDAAPAPADADPAPLTPAATSSGYARSVESRISIEPDGKGGMRRTKVDIIREWTPGNDKERVRKFVNDVEVDPETDQPLQQTAPATPTTAPADPAAPATPAEPATAQPQA